MQRDNDLNLKDWEWDRIISLPSVDLPFPLKMHAIASVNESVSIITGGYGPMNGIIKTNTKFPSISKIQLLSIIAPRHSHTDFYSIGAA